MSTLTRLEVSSEENLTALLEKYGVDITLYGKGNAKSIHKLYKEIEEGETSLYDHNNVLIRQITVLILLVKSGTRVLLEKKQIFSDGQVRERNAPLAEKMKLGEKCGDAITRAIKEELGSILSDIEPSIVIDNHSHLIVQERSASSTYPGLITGYAKYYVAIEVDDLPTEPFITHEVHVTNYWAWEEMTTTQSDSVVKYLSLLDAK